MVIVTEVKESPHQPKAFTRAVLARLRDSSRQVVAEMSAATWCHGPTAFNVAETDAAFGQVVRGNF